MNTAKRLDQIETGLAAMPCPMCGQTPPSEQAESAIREQVHDLLAEFKEALAGDDAAARAALLDAAPTLGRYLP